jgi:gamma-glutamylaminecyclotransferase
MTKVFVYGTLKAGYGNHQLLADSISIGDASTVARWAMIDSGFPVVLPGDDGQVVGEVYDIDKITLQRLDRLESNGHMYQREVVDVALANGEVIQAWMYVGVPDYWHMPILGQNLISPHAGYLTWRGYIYERE